MLVLAGISSVFPKEGIIVFDQKLSFPNLASYFSKNTTEKADISKIVAFADEEDKLSDEDSSKSSQDSLTKKEINYKKINDPSIKLITSIQYKDSSKTALNNFLQTIKAFVFYIMAIRKLKAIELQITYVKNCKHILVAKARVLLRLCRLRKVLD
jgi:hypothetical protein